MRDLTQLSDEEKVVLSAQALGFSRPDHTFTTDEVKVVLDELQEAIIHYTLFQLILEHEVRIDVVGDELIVMPLKPCPV